MRYFLRAAMAKFHQLQAQLPKSSELGRLALLCSPFATKVRRPNNVPTHSLKPHQLPVSLGHSKLPAVPHWFDTQNEILVPTTSTQDWHVFKPHQERQEPQGLSATPTASSTLLARNQAYI